MRNITLANTLILEYILVFKNLGIASHARANVPTHPHKFKYQFYKDKSNEIQLYVLFRQSLTAILGHQKSLENIKKWLTWL